MVRVVAYPEYAVCAVRVDEVDRDEVLLVEVAPIRDSKRPSVCDGMADGAPGVEDAHASFQNAVSLFREVILDALYARVVRLVDVDTLLKDDQAISER